MEKLAEDSGSRRSMFIVRQFVVAILERAGGGRWGDGSRRVGLEVYENGRNRDYGGIKKVAAETAPRLGCLLT